jgi:hypothetical protein
LKHFGKGIQKTKIKIVISTREKKRQKRKQQKNSRRNRNPGACGWAGRGARTTPFNTPEPEKRNFDIKIYGQKKGKKEKKNEGGKSLNGRQIIYTCHLVVLALKEERQHAVSPVAHHVRRVIYL